MNMKPEKFLQGRVALITGGTSGIGNKIVDNSKGEFLSSLSEYCVKRL